MALWAVMVVEAEVPWNSSKSCLALSRKGVVVGYPCTILKCRCAHLQHGIIGTLSSSRRLLSELIPEYWAFSCDPVVHFDAHLAYLYWHAFCSAHKCPLR